METQTIKTMHLTEAILTEILVRLPLRIIARFKSVSKSWKSTIESVYFRRLFVSLHRKSSTSWSLMMYGGHELVGYHGCETWDLQKSLAFFIPPQFRVTKASSHGLVLIEGPGCSKDCFVGNPVLHHWIKIPPPPSKSTVVFGLVTRVDDDGFVLGFKVVRLANMRATDDNLSFILTFVLYSSETGIWTSKSIQCPYSLTSPRSRTVNGTVYYYNLIEPGVLVAYDFYTASSDQFRVIHLPDHPSHEFKSALTSSEGFLMYIRTLAQSSSIVFKAWRLNNDDSSWQLLWNIDLPLLIGEYVPVAMHPFDSDIVYLWSQENRRVVSCNLRTQNNRILGDAGNDDDYQDCVLNQRTCETFMDGICRSESQVALLPLVIPRWMQLVPCPPDA